MYVESAGSIVIKKFIGTSWVNVGTSITITPRTLVLNP